MLYYMAVILLSGEFDRCLKHTSNNDMIKQLNSHSVWFCVLLLVFTFETVHSCKEPCLQKL